MRKAIVVLGLFLLLPLVVTQAHDTIVQQPIIALMKGKLYAVSAVNGSAQVLVEPAADELLSHLWSNAVSPDGKWLVYGVVKVVDTPANNLTRLSLLNLEDHTIEPLNPTGGVFDRPVVAGHIIQLFSPVWSYDGSRLYFTRSDVATKGRTSVVARQLVYYTLADGRYHLAGRIDPKAEVEALTSIEQGIVLRTYMRSSEATDLMLYSPDNSVIHQQHNTSLGYSVSNYEGRVYYTQLQEGGRIKSLIDAETGAVKEIAAIAYPAMHSSTAGEKSIRVYQYFTFNGSRLNVYTDQFLESIRDDHGLRYALAPDGQSLAFIQYGTNKRGTIQIIDTKDQIRELPFEAQELVWGTQLTEVFMPPAVG